MIVLIFTFSGFSRCLRLLFLRKATLLIKVFVDGCKINARDRDFVVSTTFLCVTVGAQLCQVLLFTLLHSLDLPFQTFAILEEHLDFLVDVFLCGRVEILLLHTTRLVGLVDLPSSSTIHHHQVSQSISNRKIKNKYYLQI